MANIIWKSASDLFEEKKQKKKDELSIQCGQAIISGFTSSALGVAHIYPSDDRAQRNFSTILHRFSIDPNYTSTAFQTLDAGFLEHSNDQFLKVFQDGHDFGEAQEAHLNDLKAKVDALTYPTNTDDDLNAITW